MHVGDDYSADRGDIGGSLGCAYVGVKTSGEIVQNLRAFTREGERCSAVSGTWKEKNGAWSTCLAAERHGTSRIRQQSLWSHAQSAADGNASDWSLNFVRGLVRGPS